jgi:predicted secreted Zn-dependent protease
VASYLTHYWSLNLTLAITLLVGCSGVSLQTPVSAPTAAPTETNSPAQKAEISTLTDYVYYQVTGFTVDELRAQMDQLGRTDESEHHRDAYMAALRLHEDGHRRIAIEAGYEILQAINALPAYSSCSELELAADAVGESILEQYRRQEAVYDQNTGHGATQGVHFP